MQTHAKILCWAEPFGFGPTAALSYFAPFLPGPRDFAGTSFTSDLQNTNTFRRILHCDSVLSDEGAAQFRELCSRYPMTFISCDFKAAEISVAAGCKTILYDPICWFWRGKLPEICHQVDAYICQDFFGVQERLEQVRLEKEQINAYLVPPLFPQMPIPLKCCNEVGTRDGILVNLGGLQNPFMDLEECRKYAALILDTVAKSANSSYVGYSSRAVVEGVKGHPVYTGTPEELRKKLASSTVSFMTPGLGNIYDASILGNVVCFLPPTNDSQGQQLNQLRKANLAPFSLDWHEIIEGIAPIDYAAPSQEAISKQISDCLRHLIEDTRAQKRYQEKIGAMIHEATGTYRQPLTKLVELFGSSKTIEQEIEAIVHKIDGFCLEPHKPKIMPTKPPIRSLPLQVPACNEGIDDPKSALQKLHAELNGTGFHTLSYLLEFLTQVYMRYGSDPHGDEWQQALLTFQPDPVALLNTYGSSYCVPIAEMLQKRAQDELGIAGQIVYVEYKNSKRPLNRVWYEFDGPVHTDIVFQYRKKGKNTVETIHIVCGLGDDASRFKYFSDVHDHQRFLIDEKYSVDAAGRPLHATDRSTFYKDVLQRWDFVEIVKGPKVNRHSPRFSVDMIRGIMKQGERSCSLDEIQEGYLEDIQKEFAQPDSFIDAMHKLAILRRSFIAHVLGNNNSHLEHALQNLPAYGLGWVENFALNKPKKSVIEAIDSYFTHPSHAKVEQFMRYLAKASSVWLGMQTKAPDERDLETLILQAAIMLDHHVVIQREKLLTQNTPLLPNIEALRALAEASYDPELFIAHTEQILLDHLLLAYVEAGITPDRDAFIELLDARGVSQDTKNILVALLNKMIQRESNPLLKFAKKALATSDIDKVESYYWDNIPIRALLRELPQATRAFSVAAQCCIFDDAKMLGAILARHQSEKSVSCMLDSLFNDEIMMYVQRYAGVGLGPQMIALYLDAAEKCGLVGRFQSETLVGFAESKTCKPHELHTTLRMAEAICNHPVLRKALLKHWGLASCLDAESLQNLLSAELIVNFLRSRFLGQFLDDDANLVEILAHVITDDRAIRAPHQHPSFLRKVERAILKASASNAIQGPLGRLRTSIQHLNCHPFGLELKDNYSCTGNLDTLEVIEDLQSDVDSMLQFADRKLARGLIDRLANMRADWIENELPYYEPNCAISVVPRTCTQILTEDEQTLLAFYEKVRIFWQDPFGVCRAIQRVVCLLENQSLEELLESVEKSMNFAEIAVLDKGFTPEAFYAVLRGGHPFNDIIFLSQPHGSRAHRVQWLLLYLEFGDSNIDLAYAYRQLGNEELIKKLGYPVNSTLEDIWRLLFDNLHQRNFSCADHVMRVLTKQLGFNPDQVRA